MVALKKLSGKTETGNLLILCDGSEIECGAGAMHDTQCKQVGTSLSDALKAGVCRTHYNRESQTFAVECGRELTDAQIDVVNKVLVDRVVAYILIKHVNGKYEVKDSFRKNFKKYI